LPPERVAHLDDRHGVLVVEVPLPAQLAGTTVPITVEKALAA
jgi:hypothetical protein